jgi:hypothetical protein
MNYSGVIKALKEGKKIIVVIKEKHGEWIYLVENETELRDLCCSLVQRRDEDRYYPAPEEPKKPSLDYEQMGDLPDGPVKAAEEEWSRYRIAIRENTEAKGHHEWKLRALEGDMMAAFLLLTARNDYEYEGFEVEPAQKAKTKK